MAELLLWVGSNPSAVNIQGATALHLAAATGSTEVVWNLLQKGASVDAQDRRGWTPLHEARWRRRGVWVGGAGVHALLLLLHECWLVVPRIVLGVSPNIQHTSPSARRPSTRSSDSPCACC